MTPKRMQTRLQVLVSTQTLHPGHGLASTGEMIITVSRELPANHSTYGLAPSSHSTEPIRHSFRIDDAASPFPRSRLHTCAQAPEVTALR